MTDEQIKQNAEIRVFTENSFRKEHKKLILTPSEEKIAKDFYVAGAYSRDEEIEELKEEIESLQEQYNTCFDGFTKRGKKLGELMKENIKLRDPWISVEEGLPIKEKEDDVFLDCFVKLADGCTAICYFFYDSQIWSPLKDCYVLFDKGRMRVTHWMPIPKLKKGE